VSRIISGVAGSLRLRGGAQVTRPTADRVRESLFSKLEAVDAISGARVLDLYAGTGALALEALSRGAASATMVESNPAAAKVARENTELVARALRKAGLEPKVSVAQKSVQKFLASPGEYDLVFSDPPYEMSNTDVERDFEMLSAHLPAGATVVLERSKKTPGLDSAHLNLVESRNYGDTILHFYKV
jgi:16S rRNA (guanine966-N2)-methyltransferase